MIGQSCPRNIEYTDLLYDFTPCGLSIIYLISPLVNLFLVFSGFTNQIHVHDKHRVFSCSETFKVHGKNVLISWSYFPSLRAEKSTVFRAFPNSRKISNMARDHVVSCAWRSCCPAIGLEFHVVEIISLQTWHELFTIPFQWTIKIWHLILFWENSLNVCMYAFWEGYLEELWTNLLGRQIPRFFWKFRQIIPGTMTNKFFDTLGISDLKYFPRGVRYFFSQPNFKCGCLINQSEYRKVWHTFFDWCMLNETDCVDIFCWCNIRHAINSKEVPVLHGIPPLTAT